jgi:hypothetical protein
VAALFELVTGLPFWGWEDGDRKSLSNMTGPNCVPVPLLHLVLAEDTFPGYSWRMGTGQSPAELYSRMKSFLHAIAWSLFTSFILFVKTDKCTEQKGGFPLSVPRLHRDSPCPPHLLDFCGARSHLSRTRTPEHLLFPDFPVLARCLS